MGACCPTNVDGVQGLAGDLPSIAPLEQESEAVLKVGRAENRGLLTYIKITFIIFS